MFVPQSAELPGRWPACRMSRCGSTVATARLDVPLGPIVVACENGHFRGFRAHDDFRRGARFAGCFDGWRSVPDVPANAPERRVEPSVRRRMEVLEDADRCALCGTPPAQHPLRGEDVVRTDRNVWTWLQRWRPALFADVAGAITVARAGAGAPASWRLALPADARERIVDALRESALTTDQVVPPARLVAIVPELAKRELDFAVGGLLIAACSACAIARASAPADARAYLRTYVDALHGGDERLARADAARWRMMEKIASAAARAGTATTLRTA